MLSHNDISQALSYVDAHDRETWVRMAMAVKSELGDGGFSAWDSWSASADNYDPKAAKAVWRSIKPFGQGRSVTIGSLIAEASARGWKSPWHGESPEQRKAREQEMAQRRRKWIEQQQKAETERDSQAMRVARRAQELLQTAKPRDHGYLKHKGLGDMYGLVLPDESLFVPMRHWQDNNLQGAQIIRLENNEWTKKMLSGMRAKGAVLRLGKGSETYLCEGYATGLSIDLAARRLCLDASVVVCFSAGNLVHVASLVHGRRYVFADHDPSGVGEQSAQKTGLPYVMSPIQGEDANDLHQRAGLLAVCELLMEVRRL